MTITSASANTVLLQKDGAVDLASFVIKPSNSDDDSEADLDELTFTINNDVAIDPSDIKVKIGKSSTYTVEIDGGVYSVEDLDETLDSAGTDVVISVKSLPSDPAGTTLELITPKAKTFNKLIVPALVKIKSQKDLDGSTEYVVSVEKYDSAYTVANIDLDGLGGLVPEFADGDDFEIENPGGNTILIGNVSYDVFDGDGNDIGPVAIDKATFNDYFKVNGSYLRVYKVD